MAWPCPPSVQLSKALCEWMRLRKPKALEDGDCDQHLCGLGASPFSGLQPASPGDLQRCQLRQRELCGGPGTHVWVCVSKAVYLGVPLCGTVSPGQLCVSVCLALNLPFPCLDMCLSSAYPPLCLSPRVPISEGLSVSLFPPSLSLCTSVPVSVCMGLLCLSVSLFFPAVGHSVPVDVSLSPSPWGLSL